MSKSLFMNTDLRLQTELKTAKPGEVTKLLSSTLNFLSISVLLLKGNPENDQNSLLTY